METTPELEAMCAAFKAELTRQGVIYQPEADWPAPTDLCMSTGERADLAAALRAALSAILEPSFPAVTVGLRAFKASVGTLGETKLETQVRDVQRAMIDHILGKPA